VSGKNIAEKSRGEDGRTKKKKAKRGTRKKKRGKDGSV